MRNTAIPSLISLVMISALCVGLESCNTENESEMVITFTPLVNGEPLAYGKSYSTPDGNGEYEFTDFMFYISNVQLTGDSDNVFTETDSYHLVKFNNAQKASIVIDSAQGPFNQLKFSIGIDELANLSPRPKGDLDPTNQMAWNWTAGYKFLLLEGKYDPGSGRDIPLVYHIGFSENKRDLVFPVEGHQVNLDVEISALFHGPHNIDLQELPEVLFNEDHASLVADNYSNGFIVSR